jgi:hypothetical protein
MILKCIRPISQFKVGDLVEVEGVGFDHNDFELVPEAETSPDTQEGE